MGKGQLVGPAGQVLPHDRDGQRNVRPAGAVLPTTVCYIPTLEIQDFHWSLVGTRLLTGGTQLHHLLPIRKGTQVARG